MTRREQRIKKIRERINYIDRKVKMLTRGVRNWYAKPVAIEVEKLYDRRDAWEERLVLAEMS